MAVPLSNWILQFTLQWPTDNSQMADFFKQLDSDQTESIAKEIKEALAEMVNNGYIEKDTWLFIARKL